MQENETIMQGTQKGHKMKLFINFSNRFTAPYFRLALALALLAGLCHPQPARAAPGWTNLPSMSTPRQFHTATLLPNGKVLVVGGHQDYVASASAELYDLASHTWAPAAPMHAARYFHTATLLPNGKVLVVGGTHDINASDDVEVVDVVELYDPLTNTWTIVAPLQTARGGHTATLLGNGNVLVVGGGTGDNANVILSSAELYDPLTNQWTYAAAMDTARCIHTATLLPGDDTAPAKVLVAGGVSGGNSIASVEIYDPLANTWTPAAALHTARFHHTATLLYTGRVLVVGGVISGPLASVEIYDPAADRWTDATPLNSATAFHTASLLPNGNVLVVGSDNASQANIELYNPTLDAWTTSAAMNTGRASHTATLLPDGSVLVAGGGDSDGTLASAEVYTSSPVGSWSSPGGLSAARFGHTATLLLDGRVLSVGGHDGTGFLSSSELFDPVSRTWTSAAALHTPRAAHRATLLADGRVLVTGGYNDSDKTLGGAEVYDPASNTWTTAAPLAEARQDHTATILPDGKVLVAGGFCHCILGYRSSVELYDPLANTWTNLAAMHTARMAHSATWLANGKLLVVGGGAADGYTSTELYDPLANTWSYAAPLNTGRAGQSATLLPDHKLLVTGGTGVDKTLASTELYDPQTNTWTYAASLSMARFYHTATLLPTGKVLVLGGSLNTSLSGAELYDPLTGAWSSAASMGAARKLHTATLLLDGSVLAVGGQAAQDVLSSAEQFDLGFQAPWRPIVTALAAPAALGQPLVLTGANFRGYGFNEAFGGASGSNSPTNYPLVQVQRLDNDQSIWLTPAAFSAGAYTSQPLEGLPAGPALVTVFVNGIPSPALPITLTRHMPQVSLAGSPNPAISGQPVVFTVRVAAGGRAARPASIDHPTQADIPGGTVTFKDGAAVLGSSPLVNGSAAFTTTALAVGSHAITSDYSGDLDFAPASAALPAGLLVSQPPTITLAAFDALALSTHQVQVRWETVVEPDAGGFNLYRSAALDGERVMLNHELIPGQAAGAPAGAAYTFTDSGVKPGRVYSYWLEFVDAQGRTPFGPVTVNLPWVTIYLPVVNR